MKQCSPSLSRYSHCALFGLLLALCRLTTSQAQVSGVVFRDFDLNGIRSDTLPIEVGVAGVMVRAFVDLSKTPVSTTTAADGSYSFSNAQVPAGVTARIEFGNFMPGDYNGPFGAGSATSVQFIKAPATTANLGINYPADYCQRTNIMLVTPCYTNGNTQITTDAAGNPVPADRQSALADALVSFPYEAMGVSGPGNFPVAHMATAGEVGSIWALAYQRRSKKLFSAAVVKRHMSFGPGGPGGIYATDVAAGTTSLFMSVSSIGIDVGDDPHNTPLANLFGDKTQASTDPNSMTAMGRTSFGGMDMSEDDKSLYFVNLKDRKVYSLFIDSPAVVPTSASAVKSWDIPNPGCSNGDFRPWALKVYRGKVYVGVVCSAETSQLQSDLKATIYRFDPTVANPVFEEALAFPLDFRRGPADLTGTCIQYDHWLPWTEAWPAACGTGDSPRFVMYPQPIVMDLEFDNDGSMLIGFLDRFGHMAGIANRDPSGNGLYDGFTGGDLLRANNDNGTFVLESNGKAGPLTGSGVGNNEGPNGGEFYGKDNWFFVDHIAHAEVTNGALTFIPGYNEIIASAFDPIENVFQAGGFKAFDMLNGRNTRNFVLYTVQPGTFGKASGLGDNKALCDPATVEIGNRVWFDDNRDGIQDAYEPGIDGIVLTLHDMENGGAPIGTQTSHDGGQFYFNNTTVPGGLKYGHKYEIRMDTLQLPLLDITLKGTVPIVPAGGRRAARGARQAAASTPRVYTLSPAKRSDFADPSLRDSNAQMVGGSAVIVVTSQDAGQNDFTNDLSIYSCPQLSNEKDTVALCSGFKIDSIATQGTYLSRVDSIRYVLFTTPQSGTAAYGSGGTVLGTVYPNQETGRAVLKGLNRTPVNSTSVITRQYIYSLVYPMPENPACRQLDETTIEILPGLSATAVGGAMTCTVKSVTLTGGALYGDGTPAPKAMYAWTGPDGFTSAVQSPTVAVAGTYTLTISSLDCPGSFNTATATVTSNTAAPVMTAKLTAKTCPTCKTIMTAESPSPDAIFSWAGPNGFAGIGAMAEVVEDGEYTVTCTVESGCFVSARLFAVPFECPSPVCAPIIVQRVR